jgi:hypothetical protein
MIDTVGCITVALVDVDGNGDAGFPDPAEGSTR